MQHEPAATPSARHHRALPSAREHALMTDDVRVHVATLDTAAATELCIRTMHRFAGRPFQLVVGDSGSTDRSLPRLRAFERRGWLRLEVAPEGRRHAQWLDHWVETCPARHAVFVDSDMRFHRAGWLDELVETAVEHDAVLVTSRIQTLDRSYVDKEGRTVRWARRPTPWLMLVDVPRVRAMGSPGFGLRRRDDPTHPGDRIALDTGAALLQEIERAGLPYAVMPEGWSEQTYRHYGGMTWTRGRDDVSRLRHAKQALKNIQIHAALAGARLTCRRPSGRAPTELTR